jgi:hypothetical protein
MTHVATFVALDWLLRLGMAAAIAYAIHVARRERHDARKDAEVFLHWRLMELLPMPHLGDRGTLLAMLHDLAPDHDLAVYTASEPALLVARRHPLEPPGASEARWVEVHRASLLDGHTVREETCGTLIPLRLRDGRLTGAVIVATQDEITLDAPTRATLRHVAALIAVTRPREGHNPTWHADVPAR